MAFPYFFVVSVFCGRYSCLLVNTEFTPAENNTLAKMHSITGPASKPYQLVCFSVIVVHVLSNCV